MVIFRLSDLLDQNAVHRVNTIVLGAEEFTVAALEHIQCINVSQLDELIGFLGQLHGNGFDGDPGFYLQRYFRGAVSVGEGVGHFLQYALIVEGGGTGGFQELGALGHGPDFRCGGRGEGQGAAVLGDGAVECGIQKHGRNTAGNGFLSGHGSAEAAVTIHGGIEGAVQENLIVGGVVFVVIEQIVFHMETGGVGIQTGHLQGLLALLNKGLTADGGGFGCVDPQGKRVGTVHSGTGLPVGDHFRRLCDRGNGGFGRGLVAAGDAKQQRQYQKKGKEFVQSAHNDTFFLWKKLLFLMELYQYLTEKSMYEM